jgi:hypothetical protein
MKTDSALELNEDTIEKFNAKADEFLEESNKHRNKTKQRFIKSVATKIANLRENKVSWQKIAQLLEESTGHKFNAEYTRQTYQLAQEEQLLVKPPKSNSSRKTEVNKLLTSEQSAIIPNPVTEINPSSKEEINMPLDMGQDLENQVEEEAWTPPPLPEACRPKRRFN